MSRDDESEIGKIIENHAMMTDAEMREDIAALS